MGRRSSPSRGSAFGRGRSPSPSAPRRPAPAPQPTKAVAQQPPTQMSQPAVAQPAGAGMGLMANVASTAAGVAIGHTVGHALTGALMGGNNHDSGSAVAEQQQPGQQYAQQPNQPIDSQNPCKYELEQFLSCAQNQSNDLTLCDGFNQVLRECKTRYGHMYQ